MCSVNIILQLLKTKSDNTNNTDLVDCLSLGWVQTEIPVSLPLTFVFIPSEVIVVLVTLSIPTLHTVQQNSSSCVGVYLLLGSSLRLLSASCHFFSRALLIVLWRRPQFQQNPVHSSHGGFAAESHEVSSYVARGEPSQLLVVELFG